MQQPVTSWLELIITAGRERGLKAGEMESKVGMY